MRRLIILLLAVIVPIKAWAGIAMPLALKMTHTGTHSPVLHAGVASGLQADHAAAGHAECCDADEFGAAAHSHECPHLVMPLLAAPPLLVSFNRTGTPPPAMPTSRLRSIVHDVLLQPPLALL